MKHAQKITDTSDGCEIFDDFEALTALVQKSFNQAVKKAITENDDLGIPSPYSKDGKVFLRQPLKTTHAP